MGPPREVFDFIGFFAALFFKKMHLGGLHLRLAGVYS